jgi:hypothetical protein
MQDNNLFKEAERTLNLRNNKKIDLFAELNEIDSRVCNNTSSLMLS